MPMCDYVFGPSPIESVRRRFRLHYEEDDHSLYDRQDVDNVLNDDWWIIRYLNDTDCNETESYQRLIQCMKWRKFHDIRGTQDNHFPEEIFRLGAIFLYEDDKNGSATLYIRLKLVKRSSEIVELMKRFLAHCINKVDEVKGTGWQTGWVLIVDFGGIGIQNIDFELTKFLVHTLKTYFPSGIAYAMCVDFPWVLRTFLNAIKSLIPANRRYLVKFTSRSETRDYIDECCLPDFMYGYCGKSYQGMAMVPKGCPTFSDYCQYQLGLPIESCRKIVSNYEKLLPDC